jgi:hypothetical protein
MEALRQHKACGDLAAGFLGRARGEERQTTDGARAPGTRKGTLMVTADNLRGSLIAIGIYQQSVFQENAEEREFRTSFSFAVSFSFSPLPFVAKRRSGIP